MQSLTRVLLVLCTWACLQPVTVHAAPLSPQPDTLAEPSEGAARRVAGFRAQRAELARALAEQPLACVDRRDTDSPVFHGCVDWHSAVHGVWALVAASRITGDRRYLDKAIALLDPDGIEQERLILARNREFEMPYGRAWFLRLAVDFERATGDRRLAPMAAEIARSLMVRFSSRAADPRAGAYDSDSWALLNLHYFAQSRNNRGIRRVVEKIVEERFAYTSAACPAQQAELAAQEFMPVCGNWAWLVGLHMTPREFRNWVAVFLPPSSPLLQPITRPRTAHAHGIDFARAWSLWFVWTATRDERYLDAYLAHVNTAMQQRAWWAGDYRTVGHWVAQFGMLALDVSCAQARQVSC